MKYQNHAYHATWKNLYLYPRFWFSKTINPNFTKKFYTIRFGWWYFGIEIESKL